MPPMSNTAPTMTGDSSVAHLTGQEEQVETYYLCVCMQVSIPASLCVSESERSLFCQQTVSVFNAYMLPIIFIVDLIQLCAQAEYVCLWV